MPVEFPHFESAACEGTLEPLVPRALHVCSAFTFRDAALRWPQAIAGTQERTDIRLPCRRCCTGIVEDCPAEIIGTIDRRPLLSHGRIILFMDGVCDYQLITKCRIKTQQPSIGTMVFLLLIREERKQGANEWSWAPFKE